MDIASHMHEFCGLEQLVREVDDHVDWHTLAESLTIKFAKITTFTVLKNHVNLAAISSVAKQVQKLNNVGMFT